MVKKITVLGICLVLLFVFVTPGLAQDNPNWIIKATGGVVYDDPNWAGIFQAGGGHRLFKNIWGFGKYEDVNVSEENIDNVTGRLAWFTGSPKVEDKFKLYLLTGAGVYHKPGTNEVSYAVGFGILFPKIWGATPLFEIEADNISDRWMAIPSIGFQITP